MPRLRAITTCLLLGAAAAAQAAVFPVGTGLGCGYATVQAAVDHAQTYPGDDVIRVSRTLTYSAQAIDVRDQTVEIVGGFDDCLDSTPSGTTTLNGVGGSADTVMRIQSNGRVTLRHLTLTGGDEVSDGYGGGVEFRGNGILEIRDSSISNNRAGYGGGIYAVGTGALAELVIGANVTIARNVAVRGGGGILAEGLEMTMTAPGSVVAFNEAVGDSVGDGPGGGLLLRSAEYAGYAYIGSSGQGGLGAFYGNEARLGGAIAVIGGASSGREARALLFSADSERQLALRDNVASVGGGALYLRPDADFSAGDAIAEVRASSVVLDRNAAPQGAAVLLDSETDGVGGQRGSFLHFEENSNHPAATPCPADQACNRIVGHLSRQPGGQSTEGATLYIGQSSGIGAARTEIAQNRGGRVIQSTVATFFILRNGLVVGNDSSLDLMSMGEDGFLQLEGVTIAGNAIGSPHVISNVRVVLRDLLLSQPGKTTLAEGSTTDLVENVIASEVASVGGPSRAVLAAPRFVDPARGDFRLRAASAAVDFAEPVVGDDRDAWGRPRDQDVPVKANVRGPRDIGAFERPTLLPLVLNSEFDGDLNLWPTPSSGAAAYDAAENAQGAGTGAARVALDDAPQARVFGASQCIHLPGPGRYALNASGKAGPNPIGSRDPLALYWQLRSDGGEQCNAGLPMREGDHPLTNANVWTRPATPALIEVTPAEWTPNSSLTVAMVVSDVGIQPQRQVLGWFDHITLESVDGGEGSTLPFADGFED